MKGSFLIKAKEESIVTDHGLRAFVMERLLNSPFARGSVVNLDKKTVQVSLEGDERTIKAFIKELEKAVIQEFGNPTISFSAFEENASLDLPNLIRSSQSLLVGQLEKGIKVQLDILETLKRNDTHLKNMPKEISGEITGEIRNMSGELRNEIRAMSGDLKDTMKTLPQEIAKAIKEK